MNWFTGAVLYILIWWVALFAVLPIGTHAEEKPDETSGWRGAPANPRIWVKVGLTTLVASFLWVIVFVVTQSGWIDFRLLFFDPPKP
jgi:predicted secreted protein